MKHFSTINAFLLVQIVLNTVQKICYLRTDLTIWDIVNAFLGCFIQNLVECAIYLTHKYVSLYLLRLRPTIMFCN